MEIEIRSIVGGLLFRGRPTRLYGASLACADMRCMGLAGRRMYRLGLVHADLSHADLRGSRLNGSDLSGASLYGADLRGADLRRTVLTGVDLEESRVDATTRWPVGFDPIAYGAVLVE